jgi:hypothetical protein
LVERPKQNVVGTKWVFRNKQDEHGVVTRNKARLVAKGYSQVEGLDFQMPIMPDAKRIERVPLGLCNFLGSPLSFGLQRNKILFPYPRPKRSMSPLVVVVHNFYRCDKLSRTMVTL